MFGCPQLGQNSIVGFVWPPHVIQNCGRRTPDWGLGLVSSLTTMTTASVTSTMKPSATGINTPRSLVSKPLVVFCDFGCPVDGGVVGPVGGGLDPGGGGAVDPLTCRVAPVVRSARVTERSIRVSRNCHETRIVTVRFPL